MGNASKWDRVIDERVDDDALLVAVDADFIIRAASPALIEELGWSPEERLGTSAAQLVHPGDLERAFAVFGEVVGMEGLRPPGVYRIADSSGRYRTYDVSGETLPESEGAVVFRLTTLSERRKAETLANEQIEVLEMMGDAAHLDDCLRAIVNMCERHLERCAAVLLIPDGSAMRVVSTAEAPDGVVGQRRSTVGAKRANLVEARRRGLSLYEPELSSLGHWRDVADDLARSGFRSAVTTPLVAPAGDAVGYLEVLRRSTREPTNAEFSVHALAARMAGLVIDRTRDRERVVRSAHEDDLTGLGNRRQLTSRLASLADAGHAYAVAAVDLDQFAWVNNRFGHAVGDELLVAVADRFRRAVPDDVEIHRPGGDEFVVTMLGRRRGQELLELGEQLVGALDEPIELAGMVRRVSASVGLAAANHAGEDPSRVLARADAAMYVVKREGGAAVRLFDHVVGDSVMRQMRIADDLVAAIESDGLSLAYQPVVDLVTDRVVGVEALVRWRHPRLGLLAPDEFVAIAEERGSIVDLDAWVLAAASAQATTWAHERIPGNPLTVWSNVSTIALDRASFRTHVDDLVSTDPRARMGIEVTERTEFDHPDIAHANVRALVAAGIDVVIDDFGTGTGSLLRLAELDVTGIKIDRSFVAGMHESRRHYAMVDAMLELARGLDVTVTAEGVETRGQLATLRFLRCPHAQGYLFARPELPGPLAERFGAGLSGHWQPTDARSVPAGLRGDAPSVGVDSGGVERGDHVAGPGHERVAGLVAG